MKKLPTIKSLMEEDNTAFGGEISKINKWFKDNYDESYQFEWDGKTLSVMDGDEKEVEKISRADLAKKVDGLPEKMEESLTSPNHETVEDLNKDIDNFLTYLYDTQDENAAKDAAKKLIDNINYLIEDI